MTALYTETLGQHEHAKTIVMVHGWAMHSGIWRELALQLAEYYQVILVDLPGHGQSKPILHFDLKQISLAILAAIPDKPCCWLGWSLGTSVVLDLYQRSPERVSSLVLLAGNPHFTRTENWPGIGEEFLQGFRSSIENNGEAALLRFLLLQLEGTGEAKALARQLKQKFMQYPVPDVKTLLEGLSILQQADLRPALSSATCPISLILGAKDSLVPSSVGQAIKGIQPDSQLSIIDDAGHIPFLSHPQTIANIVNGFLS